MRYLKKEREKMSLTNFTAMSFPTRITYAGTVNAGSVTGTIRNLAFVCRRIARVTFPTVFAQAKSGRIPSVTGT